MRHSLGRFSPAFFFCLSLAGAVISSAMAQDESYRDRQELDPNSDRWVNRPPAPPGTPLGDLEQARAWLAEGEAARAKSLMSGWTKANPDHEQLLEGVFLLGESFYRLRDFRNAYERYEIVAEGASGELLRTALLREMDVARAFLSGEKRIVWGFLPLPAYDDGIEILSKIWQRVPGTRLGEEALRLKADYYFADGQMDFAQDEYSNLAREYPNGKYTRPAMLRAAEAAQAMFSGTAFDDRPLVEARERYRALQAAYPEFARQERVPERLEGIRVSQSEKDLYVGRWYEKTGRRDSAEYYYRLVLKDWPGTLAEAESRKRLTAMGIELPE